MNVTRRDPTLVTLFFNRGAFVTWQCGPTTESGAFYQRHGIVECESTQRVGYFFVRNEHGDLELLHWAELSLARRDS